MRNNSNTVDSDQMLTLGLCPFLALHSPSQIPVPRASVFRSDDGLRLDILEQPCFAQLPTEAACGEDGPDREASVSALRKRPIAQFLMRRPADSARRQCVCGAAPLLTTERSRCVKHLHRR